MKENEFVDTNIHVYSLDSTEPRKHEIAKQLVKRLFVERTGAISIQVFCELFYVCTRKIKYPLTPAKARHVLKNLSYWHVHEPNFLNVENAVKKVSKYKVSFWDAMIIESAIALKCHTLWTEDLHNGTVYEGVRVRNPFIL